MNLWVCRGENNITRGLAEANVVPQKLHANFVRFHLWINCSNSQGQPLQDLNPLSVFAASRELAQAEFNVAQTDLNYTYLMAYNQILNENS